MDTFASRAIVALARALGGLLLLGGVGHVIGVSARFASAGVPAPERVAFLAQIALAHLVGGALLLLGAQGLRLREPRARWLVLGAAVLVAASSAADLGVVWSSAGLRAIVALHLGLALLLAAGVLVGRGARPEARVRIGSGAPWEAVVGYSRLVRVGAHIAVTGTTATTPEGHVGDGDAYTQARQAIANIERALGQAGSRLEDVVRTRIFVVDIARDWEAIGRAHAEAFAAVRPATSMVEVRRLIADWMLVEIEADAIAPPR